MSEHEQNPPDDVARSRLEEILEDDILIDEDDPQQVRDFFRLISEIVEAKDEGGGYIDLDDLFGDRQFKVGEALATAREINSVRRKANAVAKENTAKLEQATAEAQELAQRA